MAYIITMLPNYIKNRFPVTWWTNVLFQSTCKSRLGNKMYFMPTTETVNHLSLGREEALKNDRPRPVTLANGLRHQFSESPPLNYHSTFVTNHQIPITTKVYRFLHYQQRVRFCAQNITSVVNMHLQIKTYNYSQWNFMKQFSIIS